MHEDSLAELLRSPLDDEREPLPVPPWLRPFVVAAVAGTVVALAWLAVGGAGSTTVVAPTTAAPTIPPEEIAPFPPGFIAVDDDVAVAPTTAYVKGEDLVVVVTAVGAAGTATEAPAFPGGVWALRDVEGRTVEQFTEVRNPQALGTTAIRFAGAAAVDPRMVVLTPLTEADVITASVPIDLPGFPFVTGRSFEVSLASDLRLFGILRRLDEESGEVDWALRGADGLAQVDIAVVLAETEVADGGVTAMLSEHIAPPYPFQRQRLPRPSPQATNRDVLRRTGPEIADADAVTRAVIEVTVYLYRTRDEATVELDLSGLIG